MSGGNQIVIDFLGPVPHMTGGASLAALKKVVRVYETKGCLGFGRAIFPVAQVVLVEPGFSRSMTRFAAHAVWLQIGMSQSLFQPVTAQTERVAVRFLGIASVSKKRLNSLGARVEQNAVGLRMLVKGGPGGVLAALYSIRARAAVARARGTGAGADGLERIRLRAGPRRSRRGFRAQP